MSCINSLTHKCVIPYLDQGEHFVLYDSGRVVFGGDDFYKHAVYEVSAGDKGMKTMTAVLHTCLQDGQCQHYLPVVLVSVQPLLHGPDGILGPAATTHRAEHRVREGGDRHMMCMIHKTYSLLCSNDVVTAPPSIISPC